MIKKIYLSLLLLICTIIPLCSFTYTNNSGINFAKISSISYNSNGLLIKSSSQYVEVSRSSTSHSGFFVDNVISFNSNFTFTPGQYLIAYAKVEGSYSGTYSFDSWHLDVSYMFSDKILLKSPLNNDIVNYSWRIYLEPNFIGSIKLYPVLCVGDSFDNINYLEISSLPYIDNDTTFIIPNYQYSIYDNFYNGKYQLSTVENNSFSSVDSMSEFAWNNNTTITNILSTIPLVDIGFTETSSSFFKFRLMPYQSFNTLDSTITINNYDFNYSYENSSSYIYLYDSNVSITSPVFSARLRDVVDNGTLSFGQSFNVDLVVLVISPNAMSDSTSISFVSSQYQSGFQNGYNEGYTNGKDNGYNQGFNEGKENGYNQGFNEGLTASDQTFSTLVNSFINAPFTFAKEALDFDLFGINILNIAFGLLTIGIIVFILRRLL